jgi:YD repeat-containing protein
MSFRRRTGRRSSRTIHLRQSAIPEGSDSEDPAWESDESLGQASGSDNAGTTISFGRPLTQSLAGGQSATDSYTNDDGTISFFGPASVIGADGEKTKYTYTPLGQVASQIDYAGTSYSVETSFTYDAAGNVIKTIQGPVDSFGNQNGTGLVTTDVYWKGASKRSARGRGEGRGKGPHR